MFSQKDKEVVKGLERPFVTKPIRRNGIVLNRACSMSWIRTNTCHTTGSGVAAFRVIVLSEDLLLTVKDVGCFKRRR
jgi:hypothetical protein